MSFDPKMLRELTDKAIKDGQEAKARGEAEATAKERSRVAANRARARAEGIVEDIPSAAKAAALGGKSDLVVYRMTHNEYPIGNGGMAQSVTPFPGSCAAFIMDFLTQAGFKVQTVYDYDGGGMDSWYNIVIAW